MSRPFILAVSIADPRLNDPAWAAHTLTQAEDAGVDLIVLGSPHGVPFDPLVLAAWAAPRTSRMGIVASVRSERAHPFHVARALSAIDFLSDGRSGWCPLPGSAPAGMAEDLVAAARSLWNGWSADTLIIDKASGRYLDAAKVRASNYEGPFFKVAGPVNAMRPPQGHPLLLSDSRDPLGCDAVDVAIVVNARDPNAARSLLRVPPTADAAPLANAFHAGDIDGVHCDLTDAARDLVEVAARFGGLKGQPSPGATLRERLGPPRVAASHGEPA